MTSMTIDREITDWVVQRRTGFGDAVVPVISHLGSTLVLTAVTVAVTVFVLLRGRRSDAVMMGAGALTGLGLMIGLKILFGRQRPPDVTKLVAIDSFSFPSGHSMMSAVVYGLAAFALLPASAWLRAHRGVLWLVPVLVLVIGATRVYLGVHWATDVIAGAMLGTVWVLVCVLTARFWFTRHHRAAAGQSSPS